MARHGRMRVLMEEAALSEEGVSCGREPPLWDGVGWMAWSSGGLVVPLRTEPSSGKLILGGTICAFHACGSKHSCGDVALMQG